MSKVRSQYYSYSISDYWIFYQPPLHSSWAQLNLSIFCFCFEGVGNSFFATRSDVKFDDELDSDEESESDPIEKSLAPKSIEENQSKKTENDSNVSCWISLI